MIFFGFRIWILCFMPLSWLSLAARLNSEQRLPIWNVSQSYADELAWALEGTITIKQNQEIKPKLCWCPVGNIWAKQVENSKN